MFCVGEIYIVGIFIYFMMGIYVDVFIFFLGCDSIVILDLVVFDLIEIFLVEVICDDDDYIVGMDVFMEMGEYMVVFILVEIGCDFIVYLNFMVNFIFLINLDEIICVGEIFLMGGVDYD